jgi:hypothetical protein
MKLPIRVSRLSMADLDTGSCSEREYEQSNPTRLKYREESERLHPNIPKLKSAVGEKGCQHPDDVKGDAHMGRLIPICSILAVALFLATIAAAQTTSVSGQIIAPDGTPWVDLDVTASLPRAGATRPTPGPAL